MFPFWGDKTSMPVETDPATLKPGQFVWDAAASPSGPIVAVVSLAEQRADVYRNGIRIGVTTVSTGRPGHETPTGVFTILQKDKDHHSATYNNAAMPYTQRLTLGGVALHAGDLPGHPSSHGCVHLPSQFAKDFFEISPMGMTVLIADSSSAPSEAVHLPPPFRNALHKALHPDVSMMVTDAAVLESTTVVRLNVVTGDPQTQADKKYQ